MHVGVEITIAQGVLEEELQHPFRQRHAVVSGGIECRVVAQRQAIGPSQRHHAAARIIPLDFGQLKAGIIFGVGRELRRGGAFQPQVQLATHHAVEMLDHLHRAQAARPGREYLGHARGEVKGVDVLAEGFFDAGAQDFDGDLFAGLGQSCMVDLRD